MTGHLLTKRGSTSAWRRLRRLVLARDGYRCKVPTPLDGIVRQDVTRPQVCGAYANHVDHIVPRSRGGGDDLANLRAACRTCNLVRGAKLDGQPAPPRRQPRPERWRW